MSVHYTLTVTPNTLLYPGRSQGEVRNSSAFAVIKTDGSVVTWGYSDYGGDSTAVARALAGEIDVTQIYSTGYAFAALRADGSVVTWGYSGLGGNSRAVASALAGEIDVTQIYSTSFAFAALRADGSVVTWGDSNYGGNSTAVASALAGDIDVTQIFSTYGAFAALRADGSVVTWGHSDYGGNSSAVASALAGEIDVTQIFSNGSAFAALRADGSVVTWGYSGWGGDSTAVASALAGEIDVTQIYSTGYAFAALRADGSVVTWGLSDYGGNSTAVASALAGEIDVTQIYSTGYAFAALRADGSVVTWGHSDYGGNSSAVASALAGDIDVTQIYSTGYAFAALRADGSVVTWGDSGWGGNSTAVARDLAGDIDVTQIFSNGSAFAALRADGSVVTWGHSDYGGNSSAVASALAGEIDVTQIFSTGYAFAALRADGSVVTWGSSDYGGNSTAVASQLSSGVVSFANVATNDVLQTFNQLPLGTPTAQLLTGTEDTLYPLSSNALLQGITDADDDVLTITALTADYGTVSTNTTGGWRLTPTANYYGTVTLTYTINDGYGGQLNATQTLNLTPVNDAPTGTLSIVGTAKQNQQLTLNNTLADADGLGTISYQWFANSVALTGATANTLNLTQANVGQVISVQVSYTDGLGTAESMTSTATVAVANVNDAPTGAVALSGTLAQGEVLTASHTLSDLDGLGEVSYQWFAKGVLLGSGAQFTLTQAEVNQSLTVRATYTDGFGFIEQVSSGATSAVVNRNDLPTGAVTLSTSTPSLWQTLTASNTLADVDGLGVISYVWTRDGQLLGSGNRYTPEVTDLGKVLTVTAQYTDAFGTVEQLSTSTAKVAPLTPAFIVETNTTLINENGASALLSVKLAAAPTREVTLTFTSSDTSEGVISGKLLSFTASNWFTPQTLSITGQNDYVLDSSQAFRVTAVVDSTDVNYRQLSVQALTFTTAEDVTLTNKGLIPAGTVRDAPLKLYGDAIIDSSSIDPATGLFMSSGTRPINDVLQGLDGNDKLYGKDLQDDLSGGLGDDVLLGENDEDHLYGEAGNDTLMGGEGNDTLQGGTGDDVLNGGIDDLAADVLQGGAGNDTYYLGYGAVDSVNDMGLATDVDTIIIPYQLTRYTLPKGIEQGAIAPGTSPSNLIGNRSDNLLTGNDGNNALTGSNGADVLVGGAGNDVLNGGVDNDKVQGGFGTDTLTGGKGKDQFVLDAEISALPDKILDFKVVDDVISLDHILFSQLRVGALPDTQLGFSDHALDKNDYLLYDAKQGTLLYDADASGAGIGLQIAIIGKNLALTAADFMVV